MCSSIHFPGQSTATVQVPNNVRREQFCEKIINSVKISFFFGMISGRIDKLTNEWRDSDIYSCFELSLVAHLVPVSTLAI